MCEVCLLFNVQALVELRILGLQVAFSGRFATQDFFAEGGSLMYPLLFVLRKRAERFEEIVYCVCSHFSFYALYAAEFSFEIPSTV